MSFSGENAAIETGPRGPFLLSARDTFVSDPGRYEPKPAQPSLRILKCQPRLLLMSPAKDQDHIFDHPVAAYLNYTPSMSGQNRPCDRHIVFSVSPQ